MLADKYFENLYITDKWNIVSDFAQNICEGRDVSYGWEHGYDVMKLALLIYSNDVKNDVIKFDENEVKLIGICGFIHDVDDDKYDHDGDLKKKLENFVRIEFPDDKDLIMNIIHRISYSKEITMMKEIGKLDWLGVLGESGCRIRNYVSDADKIESLGKNGHDRSKLYNTKKWIHLMKKNCLN